MSRQRLRFHAIHAGAALLFAAAGAVGGGIGTPASAQQGADVAQRQALAPTPPMGWNSWAHFGCEVTEDDIRRAADAVVASGMAAAGYEYINIDDCWAAPQRDPRTGRLRPHPQRFASGIAALADYVHARGLKLGIYSSAGTASCQNSMPGSMDHEDIDARTFADWGVDRLKYDNCNNLGRPAPQRYAAMGAALGKVDRPIVYSINEWGTNEPWTWAAQAGGHTWVTVGSRSAGWDSVLDKLDAQVGLEGYSHPNAWNDPGSLAVGNGKLTWTLNRTDTPARIQTSAAEIGVADGDRYRVRDLWSAREKPSAGIVAAEVAPHGTAAYRVWPGGDGYPETGGGE